MKLVWTDEAAADVIELAAYIEKDSPQNARLVVSRIFAAIDRLCDNPLVGRPGRLNNTRGFVIAKTSCVVVYSVDRDTLSLIRIQRAARRR